MPQTLNPVPEIPAEIMPFHSESEASTDVGTLASKWPDNLKNYYVFKSINL